MRLNSPLFSLLIVLFLNSAIQGQDVIFKAEQINMKAPALDNSFTNYTVHKLNNRQVFDFAQNKSAMSFSLDFGNGTPWKIDLVPHDMRSPSCREVAITSEGQIVLPRRENITYRGDLLIQNGGEVRMTISENLFMGYVTIGKEEIFFEPLSGVVKGFPDDYYVLYNAKNVISSPDNNCGAIQVDEYSPKKDQMEAISHGSRDHECLEVELGIASDSTMFDLWGSVQAVNDRVITITNLMEPLYAVFNLNYLITDMFVATNSDPWSAVSAPTGFSDEAFDILNDFSAWAPANLNNHDIGQFWTDRNIQGCGGGPGNFGLVGCAQIIGGVCGASSYNVCEDYSNNLTTLRVLSAHEVGHLWDGIHSLADPDATPANPTTVMFRNITTSATAFTPGNSARINAHIHSRPCLADCGTLCDLEITFVTPSNETCPNANDGGITVVATTSNGPITYSITGPENDENMTGIFTGLIPGAYQVVVVDADNFGTCTDTFQTTVASAVDNTNPLCVTQNITTQLDAAGNASITPADVDNGSSDACGIASTSLDNMDFDCDDVGPNIVTLTITDVNANSTSCTATVTVADTIAPLCQTMNIDVFLDANGEATIDSNAVDDGSFDACGISSITVDPDQFFCADIPSVEVTQTVMDVNGNSSSCTATVSVIDNLPPMIVCPPDIVVTLKGGECRAFVQWPTPDVDDNCDVASMIQTGGPPSNSIFEKETTTEIEYTATDGVGNTDVCTFNVIVNPFPNPVTSLTCNDDVNVSVDENCQIAILADMFLEGGPYMCYDDYVVEIAPTVGDLNNTSISLQPGAYIVSVTDPNTNVSCWGTITVEDKTPPTIECQCDGYVPIDEAAFAPLGIYEGHTYYVSTANYSWLDAQAAAAATGAHMISINSAGENQFIVDAFDGGFRVHIGLTDNEAFGGIEAGSDPTNGWVWTDGSPVTYTNWSNGEPNNAGGNEDYAEMFGSGEWNDNTSTNFIQQFVLEVDGICEYSCTDELSNLPTPVAFDACGTPELTYSDNQVGEVCSGMILERTWTATDGSGNTATCTQSFIINPIDIETIEFPGTYFGECGGTTSPTITGFPTIDGIEIGEETCNVFTAYWDTPIPDCGGAMKIVRTWSVVDWCEQIVREGTQVIKLSDNEGPVMTCPADMEVGTDFWYCHANVSIPKPTVVDACGSEYTLALESSAGNISGVGNNYVINELPLGSHTITWIATDDCDNSSTCSFEIEVVDEVPPVPNCDEHTIVSLTNDAPYGITLVSAEVFDDGSYDNCSEVTFEARRMETCIDFDWTTNGACVDDVPNGIFSRLTDGGMAFKPCVPFACCDVAQGPIMIELKVTDAAGNENFCMVEVEVQDKLAPFIECPPNIVVSCDFWFDSEVVTGQRIPLSDDPMTSVFGTVLDAYEVNDDQTARQPVVINDPGRPTNPNDPYYLPQPYTWGIDGWADDNCDVSLDVRITIQDDCSGDDLPSSAPDHAIRYIERRFTATDGQNNSDNCRQVIWVVDFDPFYISDETCVDVDRNDGVKWPCDKLYDTCPDSIPVDEPIIYDDNCSLIGVIYEDTRFDFVDGACYKILREWTVIDWCQYETNTGAGIWHYTQVIKVIDGDGPEFLDCPEGPLTLCVEDAGVSLPDNNQVFLGEADPNRSYCSVHLEGSQTVEEFCSDYVIYDVKVYPGNGPDYVQLVDKTHVTTDENGQAVLPFNTRTAPVQFVRLNGLPYNSPFCGDYHRVLWSVEDGCGNISTCEYLLRLEDCKKPSPVCVNGLSTVVMPIGGSVVIWAKEYDVSSIDDCTHSEALTFSFSGDTYQPSMEYNCDNVPAFGAELEVNVWVADEGVDHNCNGQIDWSERNKDFCTTTIVITDNDGVCGTGNIVAGEVLTHADLQPVEKTTINLTHPTNVFPSVVTVEDGKYTFTNIPAEGPYTLTPERNDGHKNGVSTLDLVRIQKHLLGVEPFTSAYQYIAADANNSEGVSALDLVEIRKLILGIYTEFPNNTSWRFVDNKFEFVDVSKPWPFNESINMESLGALNLEEDFMAVKIGDLNNTVVANANQVVIRSGREEVKATAYARASAVRAGETFEIEVTIPSEMLGFQWTLDLDGMDYVGIESDQLSEEHIGVHPTSAKATAGGKGQMTMSYGRTSDDEPVTFTLIFESTKEGKPSDMIKVSSDITEAEGYVLVPAASAADDAIEIVNIDLDFGTQIEAEEYALYQNEPNPFIDQTSIGFELPKAMAATITIYDVTGKVVRTIEGDYSAGYQVVRINKNDLFSGGLYYYHLKAGEFTASKKLVLTN